MQNQRIRAPLLDALSERLKRRNLSFHFPGHKSTGSIFPKFLNLIGGEVLKLDLTELEGLDNLSMPTGVISESQELTAEIFGAERSFYLINGTTVGIHASILATCDAHKVCIMARNCHKSTYNAVALAGCKVEYLMPEYDEKRGVFHGIDPQSVLEAITRVHQRGDEIGCLFVLSSTYFGVVHDLQSHLSFALLLNVSDLEIAEICHDNDVPLIVDDAHGGHFSFHDDLPIDALSAGADVVIQSIHKVLTSFTQSSILHVESSLIDSERIFQYLQMLQSSSPSYLLLASLEAAVLHASHCWDLDQAIQLAKSTTRSLNKVKGIRVLSEIKDLKMKYQLDPFRICVIVERWDITAKEASIILEHDFNIVTEMTIHTMIVFALGPGTTTEHTNQLIDAMNSLAKDHFCEATFPRSPSIQLELPPMKFTPSEALKQDKIEIPFDQSVGRISGEMIAPYPPGIPVVTAGEVITETIQEVIRHYNPIPSICVIETSET